MRGERERNCFELVKKHLNEEVYFAMSCEDEKVVRDAFSQADENANLSCFPDFVFKNGFIEHFQVTSSKQTGKGSKTETDKADVNRKLDLAKLEAISNASSDGITLCSIDTNPVWHKTHSYDNFLRSFIANYEKHLKHLEEYSGIKDVSVFMIEYSDMALRMSKKVPKELLLGAKYGNLITRENPNYRLSRDIELLKYINSNSSNVDYVVFVNNCGTDCVLVDIIKTKNALEIIKLLYDGYEFHCAMIASSKTAFGIIIPQDKEDD